MTELLEVFRQPNGYWRWQWRAVDGDGAEQDRLPSNEQYLSADEAASSAATAYPDLSVRNVTEHAEAEQLAQRRKRLGAASALTAGGVALWQLRRPALREWLRARR